MSNKITKKSLFSHIAAHNNAAGNTPSKILHSYLARVSFR